MSAAFITVEWGTAALRAMLVEDGAVQDRFAQSVALRSLDKPAIAAIVADLAQRWPSAGGPVWLSGMIASELGWREVARVALPASADGIAAGIVADRIGDIDIRLLPGLTCRNLFGDTDVLRGEEMAALGALASLDPVRPVLLGNFPGMHGKWMLLADGVVETFHTAMTVELATLIERDSFLASMMSDPPALGDAFGDGVRTAAQGGTAARLLFGVRSRVLAGTLSRESAASYAWGLLIGADVAEALASYRETWPGLTAFTTGVECVSDLYAAALRHLDVPATALPMEQLVLCGFEAVRQKAMHAAS